MRWFAASTKNSRVLYGIEIRGTSEFLRQTEQALALLETTPSFGVIQACLSIIRQGQRSGMHARTTRATFVVGTPTWRHSVLWYAGAIAHDAYHAKLYREAKDGLGGKEPPADAWTGAEAEKECLAFQRQALLDLGAGGETIAYLEAHAKNPIYQGRHKGWRSWLDYLKRRW